MLLLIERALALWIDTHCNLSNRLFDWWYWLL